MSLLLQLLRGVVRVTDARPRCRSVARPRQMQRRRRRRHHHRRPLHQGGLGRRRDRHCPQHHHFRRLLRCRRLLGLNHRPRFQSRCGRLRHVLRRIQHRRHHRRHHHPLEDRRPPVHRFLIRTRKYMRETKQLDHSTVYTK